jgi:hypothetical protein
MELKSYYYIDKLQLQNDALIIFPPRAVQGLPGGDSGWGGGGGGGGGVLIPHGYIYARMKEYVNGVQRSSNFADSCVKFDFFTSFVLVIFSL